MAAIEGDLLDAGGEGFFREQLADGFSRGLVAAVGHAGTHVLILGADGDERFAGDVVDDLAGQIAMTAENGEAGPLRRSANALANAVLPALTLTAQVFVFIHGSYLCWWVAFRE